MVVSDAGVAAAVLLREKSPMVYAQPEVAIATPRTNAMASGRRTEIGANVGIMAAILPHRGEQSVKRLNFISMRQTLTTCVLCRNREE
jgi:hypothetical protein